MEILYTVFWLAAFFGVEVLSVQTTWNGPLNACKFFHQRPLTEEDVILKNNSWMGKAIFIFSSGVITLKIQRIEENGTCSDCGPLQLNTSGYSFEELKSKLTPGQKYIIGDSWHSYVEEIPVPTKCLVYRGASYTEHISCNSIFEDGCSNSDVSSFKTIIYFEESNDEGTTTYTSFESSQKNNGDKNGSTGPRGSLVLALAFFLIH